MKRSSTRVLIAAATLAASAGLSGSAAMAQGYGYPDAYYPGHPKMFRNYYVGGPDCQGAPAQLYVSPLPAPAYVGHTWITYEPLMPHEFLYAHHRSYKAYHGDGTCTTTKVKWCRAHGLPFVKTLNDGGPIVGSKGLIPYDGSREFAPWATPWSR